MMELAVAVITLLATIITAWAKMSDKRRQQEPERQIEEADRELEGIIQGDAMQRSAYLKQLHDKAERSVSDRG